MEKQPKWVPEFRCTSGERIVVGAHKYQPSLHRFIYGGATSPDFSRGVGYKAVSCGIIDLI